MRTTIALMLVLGAAPARGQQLTLYAGETRYELGDMGARTSWLGGVAAGWVVNRYLRTDLAVCAWGYQGGSFTDGWTINGTRLAAEVGFYVQPQSGWLRPYAGAGGGISVSRRRFNHEAPSFSRVAETAHAAVGTDIGMGQSWSMRTEVRVRGIVGPGATSDLTVGFSRRSARKG